MIAGNVLHLICPGPCDRCGWMKPDCTYVKKRPARPRRCRTCGQVCTAAHEDGPKPEMAWEATA